MTAQQVAGTQDDWVRHALENAPTGFTLPKRNYGRPQTTPPPATQPRPVKRQRTDKEFGEVYAQHWKIEETNRELAVVRALDWTIEAFLRSGGSKRGDNLNHQIPLARNKDKLFELLAQVGISETLKFQLRLACESEVERYYRRILTESDRGKLTLWLHLELVNEAVQLLTDRRVIWWHDGVWFLSVQEADKVRKRRKKRSPNEKRRAA